MAGAQVGCIAVGGGINVQAFIDSVKENKYVVEKEIVDDKGNKFVPIHKQS
jgi:hypothetical protein